MAQNFSVVVFNDLCNYVEIHSSCRWRSSH